jgi:hypothetical protein
MIVLGEKILHTAHEVKTARKAFLRLCSFFENPRKYPELADLVRDIRKTNGQEAIILTNGGSVEFVARSKGSGRGFTVDVLVLDEAQELSDEAQEALLPTTSSAPLGNPQWIYTGTPPGPKAVGEVFTRLRADGVAGKDKRLSWHEWSLVGVVDLDDRANVAATNPAIGRRLNWDTPMAERAAMSDEGFARERLGTMAMSAPSSLRHVGQRELGSALSGASQMNVGDGAWKWTRRKSSTDITPLYAATTALWAAHQRKPAQTVW